jgi:hypothetical protein
MSVEEAGTYLKRGSSKPIDLLRVMHRRRPGTFHAERYAAIGVGDQRCSTAGAASHPEEPHEVGDAEKEAAFPPQRRGGGEP